VSDVRCYLLETVLDDAYAFTARQAHFVLFEQKAHRHVSEWPTADCTAIPEDGGLWRAPKR